MVFDAIAVRSNGRSTTEGKQRRSHSYFQGRRSGQWGSVRGLKDWLVVLGVLSSESRCLSVTVETILIWMARRFDYGRWRVGLLVSESNITVLIYVLESCNHRMAFHVSYARDKFSISNWNKEITAYNNSTLQQQMRLWQSPTINTRWWQRPPVVGFALLSEPFSAFY